MLHAERIDKRVVSDHHREVLALFLFTLSHEFVSLLLHACAVCTELIIVHAVPTLAGVGACTLANRNWVVQLEYAVVSIWIGRLSLVAARIHRIALHAIHLVVCVVVILMEHARPWC